MKKIIYIATLLTFVYQGCVFCEAPKVIKLSSPRIESGKSLMESLKLRKSSRSFSEKELPIEVLSDLLWAAFGVNRPQSGKRTAPSAKNWQEIELYVAMKSGLYLYNAMENTLELVFEKDIRKDTGVQDFTQTAPVNLIFVADMGKIDWPDHAEFYSAIDAGYISQNVYLFCASEGLSTVVLGWVDKPALEKIMNLRSNQKVIITQPVGYPG